MMWHTSIPQHNDNRGSQQQKHNLNKSKENMTKMHHIPPLSRMAKKCKAQPIKHTPSLNSWCEIMSNDYKIFPFLTPSNSKPSDILMIPPKILS